MPVTEEPTAHGERLAVRLGGAVVVAAGLADHAEVVERPGEARVAFRRERQPPDANGLAQHRIRRGQVAALVQDPAEEGERGGDVGVDVAVQPALLVERLARER